MNIGDKLMVNVTGKLCVFLGMVFFLTACGGEGSLESGEPLDISLRATSTIVTPGDFETVTATVERSNGDLPTGNAVVQYAIEGNATSVAAIATLEMVDEDEDGLVDLFWSLPIDVAAGIANVNVIGLTDGLAVLHAGVQDPATGELSEASILMQVGSGVAVAATSAATDKSLVGSKSAAGLNVNYSVDGVSDPLRVTVYVTDEAGYPVADVPVFHKALNEKAGAAYPAGQVTDENGAVPVDVYMGDDTATVIFALKDGEMISAVLDKP